MQTRRSTPKSATSSRKSATPLLFLALSALVAGWVGCAAGSSSHTAGGLGGGGTTTSHGGSGGAGGATGGAGGGTVDAGPTCTAMQKVCNGVCVGIDDPMYGCTPTYCTPCGAYANAGATCAGGVCTLGTCSPGWADCNKNPMDGCETHVGGDPNNCGMCGNVCSIPHATAGCVGGTCEISACQPGWSECGGATDGGVPDAGGADGGVTDAGGADSGADGGAPSPAYCASTASDPQNCGGCGVNCTSPQTCEMGLCGYYCGKGKAHCPGDVACDTMLGTNQNCNFCGDTCNLPNSNSQCTAMGSGWVCDLNQCNPGWQNCNMIANDGCEVNTTTDPNNCGNLPSACGYQCPYGPHSHPLCTGGACSIVCDPGYTDCDMNHANGCEVHTDQDPGNCGTCGNACSMNHATEACTGGVCNIVVCAAGGWADCDKSAANGCEANTQTDPNNCGTCGHICVTVNGTPTCNQGMCAVLSCNPGFAHCPSQPGTNCETSTATDVNNCGACGNVCSLNNDTPSCTGGMCILACTPLHGNCDNNVGNGCETILNGVNNCGACGATCTTQNGSPTCNVSGTTASCGVAGCSAGYANCPANGDGNDCKTYIGGSDANNCGACNHVCPSDMTNPGLHASGSCAGGVCKLVCDPGWGDCNNNPSDGCEANLTNDSNNCNGCGNVCTTVCGGATDHVTSASCSASACHINAGGCTSGWVDFDGTCSDGCECQNSNTSAACPPPAGNNFGTLSPPQTQSVTANLFPAAAAYYAVTFTGNGNEAAFHPKITLLSAGNEFVMNVTSTDCSTPVGTSVANQSNTCNQPGDNGTSAGVTTWETYYAGPLFPESAQIPLPGNNGTVYIKVYRKVAVTSATCNDTFTLTVAN